MATFPGFCDFHKRWFVDACDWCERDEQIARAKIHVTAAMLTKIMLLHIQSKPLITNIITGPNNETMTIGEMQDWCWSLEHELR